MRIAFYPPLKSPDHPVPSGDRAMARLLVAALRAGGHAVEVIAVPRTFRAEPDGTLMAATERLAQAEARELERRWSAPGASPPDAWFTYHPFYKAPDWLGPRLAARFGMVYATAEASNAPKRASGPWAEWHAASEMALRAADVHFCFTERDAKGLARLLGGHGRLVSLPPFIDGLALGADITPLRRDDVRLVAVAMMRHGDKLRSFKVLAEALSRLPAALPWSLALVGDGPARAEVEAAFAPLDAGRMSWLGQCDATAVAVALRAADLYAWPGFNEAYGVSYLEAGAAGLPALAMRCGGIPSVLRHAETGWLVPEGDVEAYAEALAMLIGDAGLRRRLGAAARRFVIDERGVAPAAAILDDGLMREIRRRDPSGDAERPA